MVYDKSDMDYLQNCIFIGESGFKINIRPFFIAYIQGLFRGHVWDILNDIFYKTFFFCNMVIP